MDFSSDGALLLTAGRTTKLWDVATGACLLDLRLGDFAQSIAFAPDGQHCAFSYHVADDRVGPAAIAVELELGHGIRTLYGLRGVVERTAVSPDDRLVAAATYEWDVGLWERESGRLLGVLPGPIGLFADNIGLAFDPRGRRIACSVGHEARLWDIEQRRIIGQWKLPEGLCDSIAFSGDGRLFLVRQETKNRQGGPFGQFPPDKFPRTVRLYDLLSATATQPLTEIDDFDRDIRQIEVTRDGSYFAVDGVGTDQGKPRRRFRVYHAATGKLLISLPTSRRLNAPGGIYFDPTGKVLMALLENNEHVLFNLPRMEYRGVASGSLGPLGPEARQSINVFGHASILALFNGTTESPIMQLVQDSEVKRDSLNFSTDGRHAIVGHQDGTVSVLDLPQINRQLTKLNLGW
jgi:WD40 repeat protein